MTENTETKIEGTDAGLPPGVDVKDTSGGNRDDGAPKAPEDDGKAPKKEDAGDDKGEKKPDEPKEPKEGDKEPNEGDKDKPKDETKDEAPAEYETYNDKHADAVVEMFKEAEVPAAEAYDIFKEAADTGDMSTIDRDALVKKLGSEAKADLAIAGVEKYYTTTIAATKALVNTVHETVGGEENYTKIFKWATEKADADPAFREKADGFNAMFDLNATAAGMAAAELKSLYEADAANSSLSNTQVRGDKTATTPGEGGEFLSRADANKALKEAYAKNDVGEINRIRAQRRQSRSN